MVSLELKAEGFVISLHIHAQTHNQTKIHLAQPGQGLLIWGAMNSLGQYVKEKY